MRTRRWPGRCFRARKPSVSITTVLAMRAPITRTTTSRLMPGNRGAAGGRPRLVQSLLAALLLAAVPVFLGLLALPRFLGSSPQGVVAPVITDRLLAREIPRTRLANAERQLRHAAPGDGESLAWRGEFEAVLAGDDPRKLEDARATLLEALSAAPANPRVWTL